MIKNRVVTLGVLSGVVIIGGILFSILTAVVFNKIKDKQTALTLEGYSLNWNFPFWIFGILYIIPGILGVVAAYVHNKCLYIVTLIFDILFLIAMFIIMLVLGLGTYGKISNCRLYFMNEILCKELQGEPRDIFIVLFVFAVMTWIVLFLVFILHCYYTCCCQITTTPGVVVQSGPQTNISVSQVSQQQNSQAYLAPVNTVPAYGSPQYGQNVYGGPQYGQNVYGSPQYGPYWYGAPNGQTGYSAPNGQNVNGASTAGQNGYDAPAWQRAHSGDQQNTTATDTASAVEVHPLQDITQTIN